MKLIGMLCFYDEDPDLLEMSVQRAFDVGVDFLVAGDGPYALYPNRDPISPMVCHAVIRFISGDRVSFVNPTSWAGNEVEKRNAILSHALELADPGDWLLVFDADHLWACSGSLKAALATTGHDFAEVLFADGRLPDGAPAWYEARLLNRAIPGMHYDGAHWRIRLPDGTTSPTLRAGAADTDGPALDLRAMASVWHAVHELPPERRARQATYYSKRDKGKVES